jgi:hypothetical protein
VRVCRESHTSPTRARRTSTCWLRLRLQSSCRCARLIQICDNFDVHKLDDPASAWTNRAETIVKTKERRSRCQQSASRVELSGQQHDSPNGKEMTTTTRIRRDVLGRVCSLVRSSSLLVTQFGRSLLSSASSSCICFTPIRIASCWTSTVVWPHRPSRTAAATMVWRPCRSRCSSIVPQRPSRDRRVSSVLPTARRTRRESMEYWESSRQDT